jgi:cytoplasmic iron level regulating protein YaaA (DUF328/UPF0246 family)
VKILFSPSESKNEPIDGKLFEINNLLFSELKEFREDVISRYEKYINGLDDDSLCLWLGLKDINRATKYLLGLSSKNTAKAILVYSGVAYSAIDFNSLDEVSKEYIENNLIIFSNLFGSILAKNHIPNYKLKQANKIGDFRVEQFYKSNFSNALDEYLLDEDILDLRAGFYDKFYSINKKYTTVKFTKENKTISHWAKYYRGIMVNSLAKNRVQNCRDILDLEIDNLEIENVIKQKNITKITYNIKE